MGVEVFVPVAAFVMIATITGQFTRLIATLMHHRTLREAIRSDPASVPLLAAALEERRPWADALLGWIFVAIAIGIALYALTDPDPANRVEQLRAAILPLVVGATILLVLRFARPRGG